MVSLRVGSTHALGLAEALVLARVLGRRPAEVLVYAIEGRSFRPGQGLSPEVARAVRRVERMVRAELAPSPCPPALAQGTRSRSSAHTGR
jgi:hydrogenase maturation protease